MFLSRAARWAMGCQPSAIEWDAPCSRFSLGELRLCSWKRSDGIRHIDDDERGVGGRETKEKPGEVGRTKPKAKTDGREVGEGVEGRMAGWL